MCGLLGFHTAENMGFVAPDKEQFKQMLVLTSLRGIHSTGLAGITKEKNKHEVSIVKSTGSPYSLFSYNKSDDFFDRMYQEFSTVVGHCRYATQGEVNALNAHPFEEGHIILAHNGVINNYFQMKDYQRHKDITVDSHLIARMFMEEDPIEVLPKVEGAYVFMWIDKRDGSFNIARNSARPLFSAKKKSHNTLMFASEGQTLLWNASRNNTHIHAVEEVKTMQLYKYAKGSLEPEVTPYSYKPIKAWSMPSDRLNVHKDEPKEQLPVVILTPINKASKHTEADETDKLTLKHTEKACEINYGATAEFYISDVKEDNGSVAVTGYSEEFPNVEFKCFVTNQNEEDAYYAIGVRGQISAIHIIPSDEERDKIRWRVFLTNFVMLYANTNESPFNQEELEEERASKSKASGHKYNFTKRQLKERVRIKDYMTGETETLTRRALGELASCGCVWCFQPIPKQDVQDPSKILITDDFDDEDNKREVLYRRIICRDCVDKLNSLRH